MSVVKVEFIEILGWEYSDALDWLLRHGLMPYSSTNRHGRIAFQIQKNTDFNVWDHMSVAGINFTLDVGEPYLVSPHEFEPDEHRMCCCCHIQ